MTTLTELSFPAMGTTVRLLASPGAPLHRARTLIEDLEARLTRFDPGSELSRLNADPRETVPASQPLRAAVRAALAGAEATGGLADPTLLGAVVEAGYARSLVGHPRADLHEALRAAPGAAPGGRRPRRRVAARPRRRRHRHDHAPARHGARPRRQRQGPRGRPRRRAARPVRPVRGRPRRRPARPRHARGARPEPAHRPDRGRARAVRRRGRDVRHRPAPVVGRAADRRIISSTRRPAGPRGPASSPPPPRRPPRRSRRRSRRPRS